MIRILIFVLTTSKFATAAEPFTFIENESIRLGIDLKRGGSIGYLAEVATGKNVVNTHDLGRWIGQSYYAGPKPFGTAHPAWKDWPWNPVSAGDVYGFAGEVLEKKVGKNELYVRTRPMQWALKNTPAECTFETWIVLRGRTAEVRHRLNNDRKDEKQYPALDQELPAVYTIGSLHRVFTYTGLKPFTGDALDEIAKKPAKEGKPQWNSFHPTEGWAALVNDEQFGLGLVHHGVGRWLGGFHGVVMKGESKDDPTGYLAPVRREILDAKIAYEYRYTLVLDSVANIRKHAVESRPKDANAFRFKTDRQGWTLAHATDDGPPKGSWKVNLEGADPQLTGPEGFWLAADVPTFSVRAAFKSKQAKAQLYWQTTDARSFAGERSLRFDVVPDGTMRTYTIDLTRSKAYTGGITRWRLDPVDRGEPGDMVEVEWIGTGKE
jgi:hypothetical protein